MAKTTRTSNDNMGDACRNDIRFQTPPVPPKQKKSDSN